MALSKEEQEFCINGDRTGDKIQMYCSDLTWITKMDKYVAKSPDLFKVVSETEWGKTYEFPKKLLSIRSGFTTVSEEQRKAASDRFKQMWENHQR